MIEEKRESGQIT